MYEPIFRIDDFSEGRAVNRRTGERIPLAAHGRAELTQRFMDAASARGGSWTLFVGDQDLLDADFRSPAAGTFGDRFTAAAAALTAVGMPAAEARIRALIALGLSPCDLEDVFEAYCGEPAAPDLVVACWKSISGEEVWV